MLHHKIMLYSAVSVLFFANLQAAPGITVQNFQIGNIVFGGDDVSIDGTLSVGGRAVLNDSVELVDGGHLTVTGSAAFWETVTTRDVHITGSQLGNSYFHGDVVVTGSTKVYGQLMVPKISIQNGTNNVVVGYQAADALTSGVDNIAVGSGALGSATVASRSVAVGTDSLASVTDTSDNTAIGYKSLNAVFGGNSNTALGREAGVKITSGSGNTIIGYTAAQNLINGSRNIVLGDSAGSNFDGDQRDNICIGNAGNAADGNGNDDEGVIRIGTPGTHMKFFPAGDIFPVGNMHIVEGSSFIVTGSTSLYDTMFARDVHITGSHLSNSYFYGDVMITGSMDVHGTVTFNSGVTVHDDVFVLGSASNIQNQVDGHKLATIDLATGRLGYNEATIEGGGDAIFDDEKDNAIFGEGALDSITSGTGNVAIGRDAGTSLTTGSNNIYLGTNVDAASAGENNMVRIGTDAHRIFTPGIRGPKSGNLVVITADGELGITNASSRRYKRNIKSLVEQQTYDVVVEKLRQLQPLTFEYKNDAEQRQNIGLIAEDVAQLFPELVVLDKHGDPDSIKYELLSVLLLHAFQKTEQERDDLNRLVSALIEKVAKFQKLEELLNTLDDVEIQYLRKQVYAC